MTTIRRAKRLRVSRKLFAGSVAFLLGIYTVKFVCIPESLLFVWSVLFLAAAILRLRQRRSALFCCLMLLFALGNWRAGTELSVNDAATEPGVSISGTVLKKVSDYRVYLKDVAVNGEPGTKRPVLVTLMLEEGDEHAAPVRVGQHVSGTGRLFEPEAVRNPGGIDQRIQALSEGYELSGYILPGWVSAGEASITVVESLRLVRVWLEKKIDTLFGVQAPVFKALLTGEKSDVDDMLLQAMRLTGVVHVLTISGMHLSLMARALGWLLNGRLIGRRLGFLIKVVLLVAYTVMTGGAPGTVRALIMSLLRELARITGRRYDPLTALGAAALAMAFVNPACALSASFQFSFFVVLGILLLHKQTADYLARIGAERLAGKRSVRLAALSISAQIAAVPMQLALYGYIPLLSLLMNLAAGALMPLLMLGGWCTIGIGLVSEAAACIPAWLAGHLSGFMEMLCMSAAQFSWGILRLPAPPMMLVGCSGMLIALVSDQVWIEKWRKHFCLCLAAAIVALYIPRFASHARYVQLDVGQGDAAVLRRGRKAVLVDVGPEDSYDMLRYLRHEGLFVEMIVLSHLDEDHAGAVDILLGSEIEIGRIAMPAGAMVDVDAESVITALEAAQQRGVWIEAYQCGERIEAGDICFDVLSPDETLSGSNERSLVLKTEVEGITLLTLGDLPASCEPEKIPACDVLKVAHHGSRYATSKELLECAQPKIAVISVGRNSYGHPSDRVLQDLYEIGAQVLRTDQSGCIELYKDGDSLQVRTFCE